MAKRYSVRIIEMSHYQDPDEERDYDGFPTAELAKKFARRWVRNSIEELREPGEKAEALRKKWFSFGDDAIAPGYQGSDELNDFIEHVATVEERDWASVLKAAGLR
jgi:hypothetical protein